MSPFQSRSLQRCNWLTATTIGFRKYCRDYIGFESVLCRDSNSVTILYSLCYKAMGLKMLCTKDRSCCKSFHPTHCSFIVCVHLTQRPSCMGIHVSSSLRLQYPSTSIALWHDYILVTMGIQVNQSRYKGRFVDNIVPVQCTYVVKRICVFWVLRLMMVFPEYTLLYYKINDCSS